MMDENRRRFARGDVAIAATFQRDGEGIDHDGTIVVLGGGGLRLRLKSDVRQGSAVSIAFRLRPEYGEIRAWGKVVMSYYNASDQAFEHAVAFTRVAPADQAEIVRYVGGAHAGGGSSDSTDASLRSSPMKP